MGISSKNSKKSRKGCCFSCLIVFVIALVAIVATVIVGAPPVVQAIKSGNPDEIALSTMKWIVEFVPADKRFQTLDEAAKQGQPMFQFLLAEYYEQGKGVDKNEAEAVTWYTKAAEQGFKPAIEALERLGATVPAPAAETPQPKEEAAPNPEGTE